MRNNYAHIISVIFHPLLMPSYLFLFIILFATSLMQPLHSKSLFRVLIIIFIVTFIIPMISIGTLRLSNFISDFKLEERKQRVIPFFFVTCFYGITAYMFYSKLNFNSLIFVIFAATTALLLILTIVTRFWKISIHGAGIGGTIGFILALSFYHPIPNFAPILAASLVIAGLISYARLTLNAHTPLQVYSGVLLGFVFCFTSLYLFL